MKHHLINCKFNLVIKFIYVPKFRNYLVFVSDSNNFYILHDSKLKCVLEINDQFLSYRDSCNENYFGNNIYDTENGNLYIIKYSKFEIKYHKKIKKAIVYNHDNKNIIKLDFLEKFSVYNNDIIYLYPTNIENEKNNEKNEKKYKIKYIGFKTKNYNLEANVQEYDSECLQNRKNNKGWEVIGNIKMAIKVKTKDLYYIRYVKNNLICIDEHYLFDIENNEWKEPKKRKNKNFYYENFVNERKYFQENFLDFKSMKKWMTYDKYFFVLVKEVFLKNSGVFWLDENKSFDEKEDLSKNDEYETNQYIYLIKEKIKYDNLKEFPGIIRDKIFNNIMVLRKKNVNKRIILGMLKYF